MLTLPASIADKILGEVFDFLKIGGESLIKDMTAKKAIKKAIERAAERFANEYEDIELARALAIDTRFYDLVSVRKAIHDILEHPFDPASQVNVEKEFAMVLPASQRELVSRATQSYLEILREQLIGVEKLNDKLKLIYLKRTAEASERTAIGVEQLVAYQKIPTLGFEEAKRKYFKFIIDTNQYLDPRGITQTRRSVALKLDEVYVALTAEQDTIRRVVDKPIKSVDGIHEDKERVDFYLDEEASEFVTRTETVDLAKAIRENPRIVILGDPGSGKTTLTRFLALRFAFSSLHKQSIVLDSESNSYGSKGLPILLRIAYYADAFSKNRNLSLREYLFENFGDGVIDKATLNELLSLALSAGNALILLDGLDEIVDVGDRAEIGRRIEQFVATCHPQTRFVITSRIAGYSSAPLVGYFSHFKLLEMGYPKIEKFLRKWCPAAEKSITPDASANEIAKRANSETAGILKAINENSGVKRLASNPLMLTILALIHRGGARLPSRRVELYELAVKTLLEDWELARGIPEANIVRESEALRLLGPLAYWMHDNKPLGLAGEREVKEQLAKTLSKTRNLSTESEEIEVAVEDFLKRVREHTGIFVERAPRQYGFLHLTFEEYFAARELIRRRTDASKKIYQHRHDTRWEEPILLAIAFVSNDYPEDATDLIQTAILAEGEGAKENGFVPSSYEQVLHRDLLFAAHIIGDCLSLDSHFITFVADKLFGLYFDSRGEGKYVLLQESILKRIRTWKDSEAAEMVRKDIINRLLLILKNDNTDKETREKAALILGQIGSVSKDLVFGLLDGLSDGSSYVRGLSAVVLSEIDAKDPIIINTLLQTLQNDNNAVVRKRVAGALGKLNVREQKVLDALLNSLFDEYRDVRDEIVNTILELGTDNNYVLDQVIKLIRDSTERQRKIITNLLMKLVPRITSSFDTLFFALRYSDQETKECVVEVLGRLGATTPEVISNLLLALDDTSENVRKRTVWAFGHLQVKNREVVNRILAMLQDESPVVREESSSTLVELGADAEGMISGLLIALENDSDFVREHALDVLGQLDLTNTNVIQKLLEKLDDVSPRVRRKSVWVFGQLQARDNIIIRCLLVKMGDNDHLVREEVVKTFVKLGPETEGLIEGLTVQLQDHKKNVRKHAIAALGQLGIDRIDQVDLLLQALRDSDDSIRKEAVEALGNAHVGERIIVEGLLDVLRKDNPTIRNQAAFALSKLGVSEPEVIDRLFELLGEEDSGIRDNSLRVLINLVSNNPAITEKFSMALDSKNENICLSSLKAIELLRLDTPDVQHRLIKFISDNKKNLRLQAIHTLGKLKVSNNEEIVNRLISVSQDPDEDIRVQVIEALGELGTPLPHIVDTLLTALRDGSSGVRARAIWALGEFGELIFEKMEIINSLRIILVEETDENVRRLAENLLDQYTTGSVLSPSMNKLILELKNITPQPMEQTPLFTGVKFSGMEGTSFLSVLHENKDWYVRMRAAQELPWYASIEEGQVDLLLTQLEADPSGSVRMSIASALGRLVSYRNLEDRKKEDIQKSLYSALIDNRNDTSAFGCKYPRISDVIWEALHESVT